MVFSGFLFKEESRQKRERRNETDSGGTWQAAAALAPGPVLADRPCVAALAAQPSAGGLNVVSVSAKARVAAFASSGASFRKSSGISQVPTWQLFPPYRCL